MVNVISMDWQQRALNGGLENKLTSMTRQLCTDTILSLRLAREGEWVRIVSINGGGALHERLAGVGLHVGVKIQILSNPMDGKLLLCHEGTRLYLGGGMAHKIQVVIIKGECE